jgi:uncharacterized protein (DUF2252 family)
MKKTHESMLKARAGNLASESDFTKQTDDGLSDSFAAFQASLTLKLPSGLAEKDRDAMVNAFVAHYREIAPADATERILTILSIGFHNAAMASLQRAAHTHAPQARSEELRNATRAARSVIESPEALDARRGKQRAGRLAVPATLRKDDTLQKLYDQMDTIRQRLGAANPAIAEMSLMEVLAILPEEFRTAILDPRPKRSQDH